MKPKLALLALLLAGPASAGGLGPGDHAGSLVFDGETRIYDLHVPPSYDGATPIPLVLDIHGWLSSKSGQRFLSGFDALSDAEGFAVVWPQGLFGKPGDPEAFNPPAGPSWNAGSCCGAAVGSKTDDVGFLRTLVEAVAREVAIDRRRVYATGLSNGGALTQRLACEAADLVAAAAPVSFPIALVPIDSCAPSRPIAVLTFQGLTDVLIPYDGGGPVSVPSAAAELRALARQLGMRRRPPRGGGGARCQPLRHRHELQRGRRGGPLQRALDLHDPGSRGPHRLRERRSRRRRARLGLPLALLAAGGAGAPPEPRGRQEAAR